MSIIRQVRTVEAIVFQILASHDAIAVHEGTHEVVNPDRQVHDPYPAEQHLEHIVHFCPFRLAGRYTHCDLAEVPPRTRETGPLDVGFYLMQG